MLRHVLVLGLLLGPACAMAQDPVTEFAGDDREMNAAMATAQDTLGLFLGNVTDESGFGLPDASVKVAFPVDDPRMTDEIIWVGPFRWDGGDGFVGLLANEPHALGDLGLGDPVEFSAGMVRDWSLVALDGTLYGNYTTRVMIPRIDAASARDLRAVLATDPVPPAWQP